MSDRPVLVLPQLYILLSPGIMDILVKFEGDAKYAKVYIPEVQDNIPHDLRRSIIFYISNPSAAVRTHGFWPCLALA